MKKKKLILFGTAALAFGVGASVLAFNSGVRSSLLNGWATDHSTARSFTITASDIANAIGEGKAGNFYAGGLEFHVDGATVADGVANISGGTLYNVTFAGATTTADNWAGTGFTGVSFANFSSATGGNVQPRNDDDQVLANISLSGSVELSSYSDPVSRLFIAFGAGEGTSFTSVTYSYGCGVATPRISVTGTVTDIDIGGHTVLGTKTKYADGATFAWTAPDSVSLEPSADGKTCTVTGVSAAASVAITCTMTVNEVEYAAQYTLKVNATEATVINVDPDSTSYVQGAGVFAIIDTTKSGHSGSDFNTYGVYEKSVTFVNSTTNKINGVNLQDVAGNKITAYTSFANAEQLNNQFSLTIDIKNSAANEIYRCVFHFDGGKLSSDVNLVGDDDISGLNVEFTLTATKGFYLEGTPSFAFVSSDSSIVEVTSVAGGVATLTSRAAGDAAITCTMTIGEDEYVGVQNIHVSAAEAQVVNLTIDSTSKVEGAGIFAKIDLSASALTGSQLQTLGVTKSTLTFPSATDNDIDRYNIEGVSDNGLTVYTVCRNAVGLNGQFTLIHEFKDTANNIIYRATWNFSGGSLAA